MNIDIDQLPQSIRSRLTRRETDLILTINQQFAPDNYQERYFPKFKWFDSAIQNPRTILNIGCSRGRETFALSERFPSARSIGVDSGAKRLRAAKNLIKTVLFFTNGILPKMYNQIKAIQPFSFPWSDKPDEDTFLAQLTQLTEELRLWEKELPSWLLRETSYPHFVQADVSAGLPFSADTFDFVYARFVLNFVDRDENIRLAGMHIARVLRHAGRFALVEPAEKDGVRRDYAHIFARDVGLILLDKIEGDVIRLGGFDVYSGGPKADYVKQPVGYLFGIA